MQQGFRSLCIIRALALLPTVQEIMKRINIHEPSQFTHQIVLNFEIEHFICLCLSQCSMHTSFKRAEFLPWKKRIKHSEWEARYLPGKRVATSLSSFLWSAHSDPELHGETWRFVLPIIGVSRCFKHGAIFLCFLLHFWSPLRKRKNGSPLEFLKLQRIILFKKEQF